MEGLRYRPGAWIALARNSRLVLLPPDSGQARVDDVWDALSGDASLDAVFEAITGGMAGSLSQLPPFGLVSVDGRAHVLLRGPLELTSADGNTAVSGQHLRTWSEQVLPAAGHAVLKVTDTADDAGNPLPGPPLLLTLRDGMASVSLLEIDLGAARSGSLAASSPARSEVPPVPPAAPSEVPPVVPPCPAPAAAAAPSAVPPAASAPPVIPPAAPPVPAPVPPPASSSAAETPVRTGKTIQSTPGSAPDLSDAVPWLKLTPPPVSSADVPRSSPRTAADEGEPTETLPPVSEDHDGDTIMGFKPQPGTALPGTPQPDNADEEEDAATIRSSPAGTASSAVSSPAETGNARPADTGQTVLARKCPNGHVNPPTAGTCLTCGAEITGIAQSEPRPSLGTMRLSTGPVYELDRNVIIGRQPSASRVQGSALPRMVQVPSESGDISRSHAEIRLEGWHVMLRDLFSTNGTVLIREGQLPRRLAQGEAAILLDGDVAELGDNVSIRFEGLA